MFYIKPQNIIFFKKTAILDLKDKKNILHLHAQKGDFNNKN